MRFSWGFTAITSSVVDMYSYIFATTTLGLVTTIGDGTEAVPNALTASADADPPTQRWIWWETRAAYPTSIDGASGAMAWRDTGAQEIVDAKAQVLATGIGGGDSLNLHASWASNYDPWGGSSFALWVSTSVLYGLSAGERRRTVTAKNIFYWGTGAFSGTGQFNEGPFVIGSVGRLIRAIVSGAINYQGTTFGATSVEANLLLWGLQVVPHGDSPLDVITSTDNDNWIVRKQTGKGDNGLAWAPSTDTAAGLRSRDLDETWNGQVAWGISLDGYLSIAPPFGGSTPNFNTYGTVEFYYS